MSLTRITDRRRHKRMETEEVLATRLDFLHSDGESSGDEHDEIDNMASPFACSRIPMEEPSSASDYLDIDLPITSPDSSPRAPPIRSIRRGRLSPIAFTLEDGVDEVDGVSPSICAPSPASHKFQSPCPIYPPHRKLRSLRLFDVPHTPKTLLEKCQRRKRPSRKPRTPKPQPENRPQANINPFTPDNNHPSFSSGMKRSRSAFERSLMDDSTEDEIEDESPTHKKLALHEINTSRYNEEFHELSKLGDGEFGSVYKCVHRLDGCPYAIKKSKAPVAGSVYERNAMNEVYAHAVLGKHPHVVRYYSAWAEDDYMFIQNEYCNGGSLADLIEERRSSGKTLSEEELKVILFQTAKGLKYIHSQNLVHLDVKPGNIFVHKDPQYNSSPESGMESCEEEEDEDADSVLYKIGDLGHVTSVSNPTVEEEGDCRYLPKELLRDDLDHLTKADIFSLGLTLFEAASLEELPKNGEEWHAIRDGRLPYLPQYSKRLNSLLQRLVHPEPECRPTASSLVQDTGLCPRSKLSRSQLQRELNAEKFKNEMLSRKLLEATQFLQSRNVTEGQLFTVPRPATRMVGFRVKRSTSFTL